MIGIQDCGEWTFQFVERAPDREDGCHMVDVAAPFYERKDWEDRQRDAFWQQYEIVEQSVTAPVVWVKRRQPREESK